MTAFGWDSEIKNDGGDFKLLDPGKYPFTVKTLEKSYHNGSSKVPPCPMAIVTLRVNGETDVTERFMLDDSLEWKLCQFFTAIGDRKSGEALKMNWDAIYGKSGWVEIEHREYEKEGEKRKANQVARYIDPADVPAIQAQAAAPAAQPAQTAGAVW